MSTVQKALATQIKNIQTKTGKTLDELAQIAQASGLTKHGEIREMFMQTLGLGYGDANGLVHALVNPDGERAAQASGATTEDVVSEIYAGTKAPLRPIHDQFMDAITPLGDFAIAPKKGYVSLRRKKQFAMIGPATKARVEVGLNLKDVPATARLIAQPAGGMCNYKVYLTDAAEVDEELLAWIKQAYTSAG